MGYSKPKLSHLEREVLTSIATHDDALAWSLFRKYMRRHVTGATRRLYAKGLIRTGARMDWVATREGRNALRAAPETKERT